LLAPAKINLDLLITGKRDDGYHVLDSLVVFADYGDELFAEHSNGLSLNISGPFAEGLSADENNLVLKAAKLICDFCGVEPNLKFHLIKNLPISSGIGGGSADAAAALRLCIEKLTLDITNVQVLNIALKLGADVPVCYKSKATQMKGIGEELNDLILTNQIYLLLVNPDVNISTPDIFSYYSSHFIEFDNDRENINDNINLPFMLETLKESRNSLENAACSIKPIIKSVLYELNAADGVMYGQMSGSGATCYGLCESYEAAVTIAELLSVEKPSWWIKAVKIE
jgi:4-diphosphocytidyl-2-C-methyl-D-erythritol kinase